MMHWAAAVEKVENVAAYLGSLYGRASGPFISRDVGMKRRVSGVWEKGWWHGAREGESEGYKRLEEEESDVDGGFQALPF